MGPAGVLAAGAQGPMADAKHRQVLVDKSLPSVDDGRLIKRLKAGIQVCVTRAVPKGRR